MAIKSTLDANVTGRLLHLKNEFSKELVSLLDFWSSEALDEIHGGFVGNIDHYGQINPSANKGCILNTRILWTFSSAFRTTKDDRYGLIAKRAFTYIKNYFWDKDFGGLFWELDYLGNAVVKKKQAYVQGFGIYAFSEYYRATGEEESLNLAKKLYAILENNFLEPEHGGYAEALTENWQAIEDMRLSDKDLNAPKTMNTHLHILEPYTNLFRVWPDGNLKKSIVSLLKLFSDKIYNHDSHHLQLFFDLEWNSQFEEVSFGHDIEGAWLMNEASMVTNQGVLDEEIYNITNELVKATLAEGLDTDGSVFNDKKGEILDTDKHWWQQAEAMVGFMDAFEKNQDLDYLMHIEMLWSFIKKFMIDRENGEWFWRVNADNIPISTEDKVGLWKCPYHNGRALMELIERIDQMTDKS